MRAAFAAVVRSGQGPIPPHVLELLGAAQPPPGTGFRARSNLTWTDDDGHVVVGAWSDDEPTWVRRTGRLAVRTGQVRRRGTPWTPETEWPELLLGLLDDDSGASLEDLAGVFAGLVVDHAGRGVAVTDLGAERSLYVARAPTHEVVSSNPSLAAWSVTPARHRPALDPLGVCGLAYTKHRIGDGTGYREVRSLPIGSYARIRPAGVATSRRRAPWDPPAEVAGLPPSALVDVAGDAIAEELAAARASFPTRVLLADLTGGKDSRLVLAAACLGGTADDLVFRTDGPAEVIDVVVAHEIAELVHVRWLGRDELGPYLRAHAGGAVARRDPRGEGSWTERMWRYVGATAGFCNLWDSRELHGSVASRISGLTGEALRSSLTFRPGDERALVRRFDRHFGNLELLRPDAVRLFREAWIDELLDGSGRPLDANDRHDVFLLRTQIRSNFGPREELSPVHRLMPLACAPALHAAFAMGGTARIGERIHRDLVTRASAALAGHRFAKGGWQQVVEPPAWARAGRRPPWRRRGPRHPPRVDRPLGKVAAVDEPVSNVSTHRRRAEGVAERVDLVRELLAERGNPAWELIDRDALASSLDHYAELSRGAQVEIMGAATAAIWLSTGPT